LAIEDHKSYKDLDLDDEARFESTVRNTCGLFVTVIDQKVYLIHQTAKEFLVAKNKVFDGWKHSLDPVESELVIGRTCITYLMFTDFDDKLVNDTTSNDFAIQKQTESHGYLDYAAQFWAMHYQKSQERANSKIIQSALKICDPRSRRFRICFHAYWKMAPRFWPRYWPNTQFISSMTIASYFGHNTVVKQLLESGKADVDLKDKDGRTPLSYAAENGHEAVVKLLLDTEQLEADSGYDRTPLSYAAENGNESVFKLLLVTGKADVDSKDKFGGTPLLYAAMNGNEAVAKLLLETCKADVDSKDQIGQTPLTHAAINGNENMVKLLLEKGQPNIDSKDIFGQTPLFYARFFRHDAVAKLLLAIGKANVDLKD
jgi:hypothetical protein